MKFALSFGSLSFVLLGVVTAMVVLSGQAAPQGEPDDTRFGVTPWTDTGELREGLTVEDEIEGICLVGSPADRRADAWRCIDTESVKHDPCIENPAQDDLLACMRTESAVTLLTIEEPLPHAFANPANGWLRPLVIELEDGDICRAATGTEAAGNGQPITFECDSGGILAGEIDRTTVPWTIQFGTTRDAGILEIASISGTRSFNGRTADVGAPVDGEPTGALYGVESSYEGGAQRIEWDFGDGGMPSFVVGYTREEPKDPGTGEPVEVDGETTLRVHFFPARRALFTDEGIEETYTGPLRIAGDGNPNVHETVFVGDFEAEMTWYVGMQHVAGFDVEVLSEPARLVLTLHDPLPEISERPVLGVGDEGAAVTALEEHLVWLGYLDEEDTSGIYDEPQRRAVVSFQDARGIVSNGVVGPETWAELSSPVMGTATADEEYVVPALAREVPGEAAPPPTPTPTATPTTAPATPTPTPIPATPTPTPPPSAGVIYLTYDDGPHPTWTPAILETLQAHGASATFFVVGQAVERHDGIVSQAVSAGHAIGNHTYSHPDLTGLGADAFFNEIQGTQQRIADAAGVTSTCLRPPYGRLDGTVQARAESLGLSVELWDIDTQDWRQPGSGVIANHVVQNAHNGAVVLMHDGGGDRAQTLAATESILSQLGAMGYTFAAMDCS